MFTNDQMKVVRAAVSDKLTDLRVLLSEYNIRRERLDDFEVNTSFEKEYYEQERARYTAQIEKIEVEIQELRDILIVSNHT